jgi:hypothetical protein
MSKKLIGALVAGSLMLLPVGAQAAGTRPSNTIRRPTWHGGGHPAGPAKDPVTGYTYTCFTP